MTESMADSDNKLEAPPTRPANYQPTVRDLITLDLPTEIRVSPDGKHVAVVVRTTNWRENRYDAHCYLYRNGKQQGYLLNHTGSVQQVEWIDAETLALLKSSHNGKAQVWLYSGFVGDGWQVTEQEGGVQWFAPFAAGLIYRANRKERDADKERSELFGNFRHFEQEESRTALYYVGFAALQSYEQQRRRATPTNADALVRPILEISQLLDKPYSIRAVVPCPTGRALYLNCWLRDDLIYYNQVSTFHIAIDPEHALATYLARQTNGNDQSAELATEQNADSTEGHDHEDFSYLGTITQLHLPSSAEVVAASPDGTTLLIDHQGRDDKIYTRSDLWLLDKDTALTSLDASSVLAAMQNISAPLDRDLGNPLWNEQGIFAAYVNGVHIELAAFNHDGTIKPLHLPSCYITGQFDVGQHGEVGFIGVDADHYPEAYLVTRDGHESGWQRQQLTQYAEQIDDWQVGTVETIRWRSKDGTEIEGVLRKPTNFDPNKRYPLAFVVHGGPRGYADASLIAQVDRAYYPAIQFANADMLVLYPNYRGSTGRGQAFTELNVNNLGVGDLWDLESAIDHLSALGWVDEERVGCMGWSQGGYISAFAGLHSERFRAASVGAGISDWYTYHISNDIPYFTTDYLSSSPFHTREYYTPTAPMSNIANAKTPMLIQHGSEDRRVPLSNAMELYRGLQAMNVPVELYVYPGMGHPITKPRENHAVMCQNWAWFARYLLE